MPDRFDQISEGVYRGGVPSEQEIKILSDVYGIERIISLDGELGAEISPICYQLGIDHIIIPISGIESVDMINFFDNNVEELFSLKPVYVHCRHGRDRTGLASALYRIKVDGWNADDALREALSYDFGDGLNYEAKKLYESYIIDDKKDSNDLQDYRHDNYESAYDALMPTPYQKNFNSLGDDIVAEMRDQFNFGDVPPAFNPQQSWSVLDDVKYAPPGGEITNPELALKDPFYFTNSQDYPVSEEAKKKRELRRQLLEELAFNEAFLVGRYDNYDGIRGAGPLAGNEETGGFIHDVDRPMSMPGAGAVNTGGFLNL